MSKLAHYTSEISRIFGYESDRYIAHEKATPILLEMGRNREVLYEVFRKNLSDPEFINKKRHYPTLAFDIFQDKNLGIAANCFMPLPDRSTDLSFQSIHHHGKLLLTTVAAFGTGYESIVFKKGFTFDKESQVARMEVEKVYQFNEGSIEFIGSNQPHVVFFPEQVSVTFAMWAYESVNETTQKLKNNFLVRKFKEPIRFLLKKSGLLEKAGINAVENFDFYPEGNQIKGLKNRINFQSGTNENFLTNVFYVLQQTGFNDIAFLGKLKQRFPDHNYLTDLIKRFENGEPIGDEFYEFHKNVRFANLSKKEILKALNA